MDQVGFSVLDFPIICGICLAKADVKPLEQTLSELFHKITNIWLDPNGSLPTNICRGCIRQLENIRDFIELSKINHVFLQNVSEKQTKQISRVQEYSDHEEENGQNSSVWNEDISKDISVEQSNEDIPKIENEFHSEDMSYLHFKKEENDEYEEDTKIHKCNLCDKKYPSQQSLNSHLQSHSDAKCHVCTTCGKSFKFFSNLIRHNKDIHKKAKPYRCELCNKGFARLERKNRHVKIHSMKSTESNVFYSCKKCEETFTRKTEYRSHMTRHGEPPDSSDTKCPVCSKVFSSKYNMQSHMVIHNETRDFLCNICGKGFSKKVYLDTHSLIHSGEKPYQCKECGKSFRQRSTYNRHVLVHTDERSFRCDQCDKTFQQKTHLTRHRMVHTGEKRFQCGYCGKKFGQNVNLKAHVRTHTGETAFHCSVCGRGFYDSSSMKKHIKGHTRDGNLIVRAPADSKLADSLIGCLGSTSDDNELS